jgi:hypothetical protein
MQGNPPLWYLREQQGLAKETLEAEIGQYKPVLVFLVTGFFGRDEIVCPFLKEGRRCFEVTESRYWSREHASAQPAVLWTSHPQGKPKEMVRAWLDKAIELYEAASPDPSAKH